MLVSVTTMVTVPHRLFAPAGVWLANVSVVDDVRPVTLPATCSPVAGTGLPSESVPWPSPDQALPRPSTVNVQVKSVDAPAASVVAPPVKKSRTCRRP